MVRALITSISGYVKTNSAVFIIKHCYHWLFGQEIPPKNSVILIGTVFFLISVTILHSEEHGNKAYVINFPNIFFLNQFILGIKKPGIRV